MSLSGEDFSRLQGQILDLRNANYELKDNLKKVSNENNSLREIIERQKKEITKNKVQETFFSTLSKVGRTTTGVVNGSSGQELGQIIQERDKLQQKLQQQEGEFKLQNSTLIAEVEKLQSDYNSLLQQFNELQSDPENSSLELRRLQLENASLLRKLHLNSPDENEVVTEENSECVSECSLPDGESLNEERKIISDQIRDAENTYRTENVKLKTEIEKLQEKVKKKQESIVLLQDEKEHLYNDNSRLQEEIKHMAIDKQKELSAEKEKYTSMLQSKTQEIERINNDSTNRIKELENIISCLNKETFETMDTTSRQAAELEIALKEASERYDNQCILNKQLQSANEQLKLQNEQFQTESQQLHSQIEKTEMENSELRASLDDMKQTVGNLTAENGKNAAKIRHLEVSNDEATQLAEKRKNMVEDIKVQCSKTIEQIRLETNSSVESREKLKEDLQLCQKDNDELKASVEELANEKSQLVESLDQLKSHSCELEEKLVACQQELSQVKEDMASQISNLKQSHTQKCQELEKEIESLKEEIEIKNGALKKSSAHLSELEQQILDKVEERRIGEQKLAVKLKDVQKAAKQEKQRADKLQSKLQEFLSNAPKLDSQIKTGYDDIYLSVSRNNASGGSGVFGATAGGGGDIDSLSLSSFGHMSDLPNNNYNSNTLSPPPFDHHQQQSSQNVSPGSGCAAEDIQHLFDRIANLQQDKWMLEEKLSHLETNCAGLSDDLIEKSRIIEAYIMEKGNIERTCPSSTTSHSSNSNSSSNRNNNSTPNQQHQLPPNSPTLTGQMVAQGLKNKVRDFIKQDELSNKDVNKRLQNMLEETLTKNIQLQKDVDFLSGELSKYQSA